MKIEVKEVTLTIRWYLFNEDKELIKAWFTYLGCNECLVYFDFNISFFSFFFSMEINQMFFVHNDFVSMLAPMITIFAF